MSYNYNKLRGRIVEKYGSLYKFAETLGISYNAISRKMNNKISFSQDDIIKWSKFLDIQPSEYKEYFFTLEVQ